MNQSTSYDFEDWRFALPPASPQRGNSISSINGGTDSEVTSLPSSHLPAASSASSSPSISTREGSLQSIPDETVRLDLNPGVTMYVEA